MDIQYYWFFGGAAVAVIVLVLWDKYQSKLAPIEHMTGFGVTSGLAFNNRTTYCQPGNGGSWSGGCFVPHHVIV